MEVLDAERFPHSLAHCPRDLDGYRLLGDCRPFRHMGIGKKSGATDRARPGGLERLTVDSDLFPGQQPRLVDVEALDAAASHPTVEVGNKKGPTTIYEVLA